MPSATNSPDMSVGQVLEEVLRANLRIRAQGLESEVARQQLRGEWGIFEPSFIATVGEEANRRQNTRERFLSQGTTIFDERNRVDSVGVEGILPTGGQLRLSGQNRGLDNNLQLPGERESESFLGVTFTQPLLKNAGWGATVAQIRLAAAQSKIVLQEFRRQLMLVLSQAELAYWDLVATRALAGLRDESVQVAERVLVDNKARVEAGKMTEIEVLQAESGLEVRRAYASEARQKIAAAMSQLNAFFGRPGGVDQPVIIPGDALMPAPVEGDPDSALAIAFKLHPLYLAQFEKNKQDNIRLAYAKNQRWPQLDLKASYGMNGLGPEFGASWDAVRNRDFPSWYVGLEMRIPLGGGVKARSQGRVAQLRVEQGLLELKAIEVELTSSVPSLARKVAAAQQKARSFQKVVAVNQRLLDTELIRLDSGKTDSRKILQAEQDLSDARANELDARLEWQRALVEWLVQTGTYLGKRDHELHDKP